MARDVKKFREARALRGAKPEETLAMGFSLMEFGRRFSRAAEDARR